jgi:uncharacterized protein YndB with AHSA1/START domain
MTEDLTATPADTAADNRRHGTLTAPDTLRIERLLPTGLAEAWAWITEPERRRRWLAGGSVELRVGGRVEHVFRNNALTEGDDPAPARYAAIADECRFDGVVTAVEPQRLLAHTWPEGDGSTSEVTFELAPAGDRTRLTITHRRFPVAARLSVAGGWHAHLAVLLARIDGHAPDGFWRQHTRLEREYAARF